MADLYQLNKELLIHLTHKDIFKIKIVRVTGGGRNYYGQYDIINDSWIPIPEALAIEVIGQIQHGKICDVKNWPHFEYELNFPM